MIIIKKTRILIVLTLLIGLLISGGIFYFFGNEFIQQQLKLKENIIEQEEGITNQEIAHSPCLGEDEVVSYQINKKENEVSVADIIISDKKTNQEKYRFKIELPIPNHYHPIELHKCGVYAIRSFNYDYKKNKL